jgi:hypothetical protein
MEFAVQIVEHLPPTMPISDIVCHAYANHTFTELYKQAIDPSSK